MSANVLGIDIAQPSATTASNPFGISLRTEDGRSVYVDGDELRCIVRAEKECYLTVVAVDSNWDASMMFPSVMPDGTPEDNHFRAGEERFIGGDVGPPFGPMWFHAIATSKPTSVPGPWDRRGGKGIRPRDVSVGRLDELTPDEWGTTQLLLITQAKP